MIKKLRSFDVFGIPFSLDTLRGQGTFTTVYGGILTAIAFILFSIITYIVVSDYRDTTSPVVSVNTIKMNSPLEIHFFENGVFSAIGAGLPDENLTFETVKKFLTIKPEIVTTTKNSEGKLVDKVQSYNPATVEVLTDPAAREYYGRRFREVPATFNFYEAAREVAMIHDGPINDVYIHGSKFNLPYRRLRYRIYPCSLPNPADCASFEELALVQFFNFGMFSAGNYSNKGKPVILFGEVETAVPLSVASTVIMTTYLKKNFIYNDDIGLLDERLVGTYVDSEKFLSVQKTRLNPTIYCTAAQIDGGVCEPYMEVVWRSGFVKTMIQRRYLTVFDSISEVGGFWDLITYGILFLYFIYNMRAYIKFLRSQMVEGFMELDQKRRGDQKKRREGEVILMRSKLMEMKLDKEEPRVDQLSLKEILNTKAELAKLIEFSYKSQVMYEVLVKNKTIFNILATKIIFLRKKSENGKNDKKVQSPNYAERQEQNFKIDPKKTILKKIIFEDEKQRAKQSEKSNPEGKLSEQKEALAGNPEFIFIDEQVGLQSSKNRPSENENKTGFKQTTQGQKKLLLTFSKRSVPKPGSKNNQLQVEKGKTALKGRIHQQSSFGKNLARKLKQK